MAVGRSSHGSGACVWGRRAAKRSPPCSARSNSSNSGQEVSPMDLAATLKLAAFAVAIEACLGYPQGLFRAIGHPVTWTGRLIGLADDRLNHDDRSFATRRALGFATLVLLLSIAGGGAYLFSLGVAGLELPQPASLALSALIASSFIAQQSLDAHALA